MSPGLAERQCEPCRGGVPPLSGERQSALLGELSAGWQLVESHHLEKTYRFPDFLQALAFTDRVGAMAEEQGHHPEIYLAWGRVRLKIYTHAIDGLTESDFVWAAKADCLS